MNTPCLRETTRRLCGVRATGHVDTTRYWKRSWLDQDPGFVATANDNFGRVIERKSRDVEAQLAAIHATSGQMLN